MPGEPTSNRWAIAKAHINAFLEDVVRPDAGKSRLIAMDHTHCFTCGRDLDERITHIGRVKDDRLYGLFPGFRPFVHQEDVEAGLYRLRQLSDKVVSEIVSTIPDEWQVGAKAMSALAEFIIRRADYVAEMILERIARACWPDRLFDNRA